MFPMHVIGLVGLTLNVLFLLVAWGGVRKEVHDPVGRGAFQIILGLTALFNVYAILVLALTIAQES